MEIEEKLNPIKVELPRNVCIYLKIRLKPLNNKTGRYKPASFC